MKKIQFSSVFVPIFATIFIIFLQIPKSFAQKIEFEKKTKSIKVDGVVFGKIETLDAGLLNQEDVYSVKDVNGKECILLKMIVTPPATYVSEFNFLSSGQKAYTTASTRKDVAKQLIKYEVLTKTGFSEEGEKKMLMLFKERPDQKNQNPIINTDITQTNPYNFNMLDRKRDANIMVFGDKVQQDFKDLGRITNTDESKNGKLITIYKIYNHQNLQIAEANTEINGTTITLTTFKDRSTQTIQSDFGVPNVKQSLSNYLSKNYYW
ncbi:MAG: hypothetical protein EAZ20_02745 [Bacteroidetes bacterium]|nr:MAG: hypothetical protein EAZ20_02745 [Bacteroidota bacterium]